MTARKTSTTLADVEEIEPEPADEIAEYRKRCPFPEPADVREALANVLATVGGLEKLTSAERNRRHGRTADPSEKGVKYAYRSVDEVAAAAQRLLGLNGLVLIGSPDRSTADIQTVMVNGNPWTHVVADVYWDLHGPGGTSLTGIRSVGEARDNSDKVWNKVQTIGRKNVLLMLLQIGDPAMDPDNEKHETDAPARAERKWVTIDRLLFDAAGGEAGPAVAFRSLTALLGKLDGDIRRFDDDDPALLIAQAHAVKIAHRYTSWVEAGHDPETVAKDLYTRIAKDGETPDSVLSEEPEPVAVPALVKAGNAALADDATPESETEAARAALDDAWAEHDDAYGGEAAPPESYADVMAAATARLLARFPGTMNETYARALVDSEQEAQEAEDALREEERLAVEAAAGDNGGY
jgi:hypothetical protein